MRIHGYVGQRYRDRDSGEDEEIEIIVIRCPIARGDGRQHTQANPGVCNGHGTGMIDTLHIAEVRVAFMALAFRPWLERTSLWRFTTTDGRGLARAVGFMLPYVVDKRGWPQPDVDHFDQVPIRQPFLLFAAHGLRDQTLYDLWRALPAEVSRSSSGGSSSKADDTETSTPRARGRSGTPQGPAGPRSTSGAPGPRTRRGARRPGMRPADHPRVSLSD